MKLSLKPPPPPLERHEQETYFNWLLYQRYGNHRVSDFAFAVPNGGYVLPGTPVQRSIYGKAMVRQGLRKGVPDVFIEIPVKPYHGLRIEFKRIGGASPGDDQSMWHARLRSQGYYVAVCYGFEQAKAVTLEYLKGEQGVWKQ